MDNAIEIQQLNKSFGRQSVLRQLTMAVPSGAVYGFLGNNGAGKSTLMRILLGLIRPDSGQFSMLSQPLSRALKARVGSLIDSACLYEHLTAVEFLRLMVKLKDIPSLEISRVLELVDLQPDQHKLIRNYSLGMKQRLALANALLGEPELLLLDEPTNGLDPTGMDEIRQLIARLPRQSAVTVLVSSHLLDEVEKIASHVGILHNGQLVREGKINDLLSAGQGLLQLNLADAAKWLPLLRMSNQVRLVSASELEVSGIRKIDCPAIHYQLINAGAHLFQSHFDSLSLEQCFRQSVTGARK
ncbi:MAG: ATP-binding cassette domain-containing protein [Gammaproteobacteria bacterium]|nr:ATP-binding cassette domain-containing protein [Gammaproteobacteria bacterium]MBU2225828.1 ATP-binding cassette domain-containing protein [Gammaproteobacteria bacterium]